MKIYQNSNFLDLLHSETFWVAVAFLIFVILTFKKIKKALIESLDKRIDEIKKRIDEAKKIKEESESNLKEAKESLKKIINDKKTIINNANQEAVALKKKLLVEEKIYNQRLEKKILERIQQSKNQAIKDIKKLSIETSLKSVEELLKNQKKDSQDNNLLVKSIVNLLKKNKKEKNYKEL